MKTKDGKCTKLFYLIYSMPMIGYCLVAVLLGYVSYFAVNVLGLSSLLVGNIILVSKVFDGITDIIAGFLIDRTNTRFGKARPYDWAYVGFCIAAIVLFCIPKMGTTAMAVCLFLTYTVIYSIFSTLYSCANAVYLARTVEDPNQQVTVNVVSMFLGIIGSVVAGIIIPVYIAKIGSTVEAWRTFAFIIGVPSAIVCSIRFFIIKENSSMQEQTPVQKKINFREGVKLLSKNKYVIILALALLVTNISMNLGAVNPFYFEQVVGDISKQSVVNALGAVGPLLVLCLPILAKKMGKKKLIVTALILGIIGKLLPLLNLQSITLLGIGTVLGTIGYMPLFILTINMVIDCMDYGEWKFKKRGEGIYSCISGFCNKIGTGIGTWLVGFVMMLGGYVSGADTQSQGAVNAIICVYTVVPAVLYLLAALCMHFYKLDDELPQIQAELAERKTNDLEK